MKHKIITFAMLAALGVSGVAAPAMPVMAEETQNVQAGAESLQATPVTYEDVKKAMDKVNGAIDNLEEFFPEGKGSSVKTIISAFSTAGSVVGSMVSIVNGSMTFLKLLGLMDDPTEKNLANINYQLEVINERLSEMDAKLDNITNEMKRISARDAFDARTQKAITYRLMWHDFTTNYMESGMDALMTRYNGMLLDGWKAWAENTSASARNKNGVDNRSLIIPYTYKDGQYELFCTANNGVPADIGENGRYLVIPAELLPENMDWNVETYRINLQNIIKNNLLKANTTEGYQGLENKNFPAFSAENAGALDEQTAAAVAEDAVSVLTYRVGAAEVNASASFPLEVKRQFQLYTKHLLDPEDGLDALIKTIFLTHAFEFETKEDIKSICDQLTLKTGVYGTFVASVLGMSKSITSDEKTDALSYFCQAIEDIDKKRKDSITGADNYCYLTNSKVSVSTLKINTTAQIKTDKDGAVDGYLSYSAGKPVFQFRPAAFDESYLIGDENMLLINNTLRSNGLVMDKEMITTHLKGDFYQDYGLAVTSLQRDVDLPVSSGYTMRSHNVIGSWFPNKNIRMNERPGKASSDKYLYHRMSKGSYLNMTNGQLETDKMLSGLSIYGEGHWYWTHDESAFLGGPADNNYFSSSKETVMTKSTGVRKYDNNYYQTVSYNTVIHEPLKYAFGASSEMIEDLEQLNYELTKDSLIESHTFDEGVITKQPTCEEAGIRTFTATDGSGFEYTEDIPPLGHDWDEGVVTLEPGTDSKGIRTYTCKHDPSHLYTECIDPAGDETSGSETKPTESSEANQNKNASDTSGSAAQTAGNKATAYTPASSGTVVSAKTASAKTGDRDYSYVWIIAAAGAAGATAIAAVIVKKRKKTG